MSGNSKDKSCFHLSNTINYFSEDFNFYHSSHCSVLFICTQQ
ncbi:hypothetical protein T11_7930, partial [Trichinella zimbabwensis]